MRVSLLPLHYQFLLPKHVTSSGRGTAFMYIWHSLRNVLDASCASIARNFTAELCSTLTIQHACVQVHAVVKEQMDDAVVTSAVATDAVLQGNLCKPAEQLKICSHTWNLSSIGQCICGCWRQSNMHDQCDGAATAEKQPAVACQLIASR